MSKSNDSSKKRKRLTITMAHNVFEDLEKMANEQGLTKSALIAVALQKLKTESK